jgi:Icc-related predicted phosphoesterase
MVLFLALALAAGPPTDLAADMAAYGEEYGLTCPAPAEGALAKPEIREGGGWKLTFEGSRARAAPVKPVPGDLILGVVGGMKDAGEDTLALLADLLGQIEKAGATALVAPGDLGESEDDLGVILGRLAATGLPVFAIPGNADSGSGFHRAAALAAKDHPNLVDGALVRRLDLPGAVLVSMPGYHDKRFLHQSGACLLKPADAEALASLAAGAKDPVVLVAHGPPRGKGPDAIDRVTSGENVGWDALSTALAAAKIPFVIAPHIIEAGERATSSDSKKLKPGVPSSTLWLNPGSASPLPWTLNDKSTTHGAAALVTLKGGKASYRILKPSRK